MGSKSARRPNGRPSFPMDQDDIERISRFKRGDEVRLLSGNVPWKVIDCYWALGLGIVYNIEASGERLFGCLESQLTSPKPSPSSASPSS